jgi:hypothetical protein
MTVTLKLPDADGHDSVGIDPDFIDAWLIKISECKMGTTVDVPLELIFVRTPERSKNLENISGSAATKSMTSFILVKKLGPIASSDESYPEPTVHELEITDPRLDPSRRGYRMLRMSCTFVSIVVIAAVEGILVMVAKSVSTVYVVCTLYHARMMMSEYGLTLAIPTVFEL